MSLLLKEPVKKPNTKALKKIWVNICNEYIKVFGVNTHFLERLRKMKEMASLIVRKANTNDKSLQTLIEIIQQEIDSMDKKNNGDFRDIFAVIQKESGFQINSNTMTVSEFYSHLKLLNNDRGRS